MDGSRRVAACAMLAWLLCTGGICGEAPGAGPAAGPDESSAGKLAAALSPVRNASGYAQTRSANGPIDPANPFFHSVGPNGRSCASCHDPGESWTITPQGLQARFDATAGLDPVFRPVDGATSPAADVSSLDARRRAYALLLDKGLIRIGIGIPPGAEFDLAAVDDPYGYASAKELSLFRRPLPSTNLKFLSTVMWDGRKTLAARGSADCIAGAPDCFASRRIDLIDQANDAALTHAEATVPLSARQRAVIVSFESGLLTAQVFDDSAGSLAAGGALGGPRHLAAQDFYFGINDAVSGDYRNHLAFNPRVFSLYAAWYAPAVSPDGPRGGSAPGGETRHDLIRAREAVARGERLFDTKPIVIAGVKGLDELLGAAAVKGTCTTCHDVPGAGSHSIPVFLDLSLADGSRRTTDLPLYTLRNRATGETVQTTDPGRALVTGKWKDVGRFKPPVLRGLAGRAPYFHNGSAVDLNDVVDFYNTRFGIGFTADEISDLVAFLRAL